MKANLFVALHLGASPTPLTYTEAHVGLRVPEKRNAHCCDFRNLHITKFCLVARQALGLSVNVHLELLEAPSVWLPVR